MEALAPRQTLGLGQGIGGSRERLESLDFVAAYSSDLPRAAQTAEIVGCSLATAKIRIHRARSKAGTYRWYSDHRLPDEHGGGTITVRLHGNAGDAKRKFNRAENVRQIPPGDPDFEVLYRRRNDAERISRHLANCNPAQTVQRGFSQVSRRSRLSPLFR